MKIVFLDVDGVLNSEALLRAKDDEHRTRGCPARCECYRLEHLIDPAAVTRLNRVLSATGAKVVISSSWRKLLDPDELRRVLRDHGFDGEVIGETPDGPNDPAFVDWHDRIERGHEIAHWLAEHHGEVTGFVILDDCSDMAWLRPKLVQTDASVGFTDADAEAAIRMLEGR